MMRSHGKTKKNRAICNGRQSGQAVVEYILMLVVLVAIGMNFVDLFAKPFQSFTSDFMGTYTSCLLETGELPRLNSTATSECQPPKMGKGTPRAQSTSIGGSGGSSGGGSSANINKDSKSGSSSSSSSSNGKDGAGSGPGGSNGGGGNRSLSRGSGGRGSNGFAPRTTSDGALSGGGKVTEIAVNGNSSSEGGGFFKAGSNGYSVFAGDQRKTRSISMAGMTDAQRDKLTKREPNVGRTVATYDTLGSKAKKIEIKKKIAAAQLENEEQQTANVGAWFRYLIIIAIIIIIIALIGGQVAQMMKSWEK